MENTRKEFDKMRPTLSNKLGTVCCNCHADACDTVMFHHIIPLSLGGTNNLSNIAPLCGKCHGLVHGQKRENWKELQKIGIEKAKLEGKYKGRKKIEIDEDLFKTTCSQWRSGLITAKRAMEIVNLKPNTFYRRVKEYNY